MYQVDAGSILVVIGRFQKPNASPRPDTLGRRLLLGRLWENRRAILCPDVVPLAVECRRVVQLEEPFLEQILVADYEWVETSDE